MAGGISDIFFASLGLTRTETGLRTATTAASGALATSLSDRSSGREAVDTLTAGLSDRLSRFSRALSRFSWPSDASSPFRARLVIHDNDLDKAVAANTADYGTAVNPFKYFTTGKSSIAASGVDAGDYAITVTQGTVSRTADVAVGEHDTWGAVLGKVASAISGIDSLSVRADVTRQQKSFTLDPFLAATGTLLAVSVNPLRRDQDVTLEDARGDLLDQLGLQAASTVVSPADAAVDMVGVNRLAQPTFINSNTYDPGAATTLVVGLHTFSLATGTGDQPTSYVSTAFDPDAATTLAPGTYTFGVSIGDQSRQLSVTVKSGWTWGEVLSAVSGQVNAEPIMVWAADGQSTELVSAPSFTLPGVTASSQTVSVPAAAGGTFSGRMLTIATDSGYEGETLTLTDGSGGILSSLGLTTPLHGQVVSIPVASGDTWKDVVRGMASVVRLATTRVAAQTQEQVVPATNVPGKALSMKGVAADLVLLNRKLGETLTLTDGASKVLETLGMGASLPGQDGEITVNGQTMASENNAYALQQGRVRLDALDETGTDLPLVVTSSMERLESRLGDVVDAYNDLRKYLAANSGFLDATLAPGLGRPVADNWSGLSSLGFSKTGKNDLLWIASDTFWHGVYTDADRVGATLATSPNSLVPGWKAAVASIMASGVSGYVLPETEHLTRVAARRTAADLERTNWLVDLRG